MPDERTLSLPMAKLQSLIGDYLGWGKGADAGEEAWTTQKTLAINDLLDTALRWVYHEATISPDRPPHQWSWLTPSSDITISEGQRQVVLPDDFAGFACHRLSVSQPDQSGVFTTVSLVGEPYIDEQYDKGASPTGRPVLAAERSLKETTGLRSNKSALYVYPEPDATYVLRGPYNLVGSALTSANPFTYGGPTMSSCFQAACRAAAEMHLDNLSPGEGPEWGGFQRALAAAISRDGRHQPKTLGRNTDRSDPSRRLGRSYLGIGWIDPVTVDGSVPE